MYLQTLTYDNQPLPLLPMRIVDVSPIHEHIPAATSSPNGPSRAARVVTATKANIVRLVPGLTPFPVGPASDLAPSGAG